MRIIGGKARGRKLWPLTGKQTRPTPDRVREALFSILRAKLTEARVLDLFAGTGALGLEAISRGAQEAVFVEHDRRAVVTLRKNVMSLGLGGTVLCMPAPRALDHLASQGAAFDLVFLDPPYASALWLPTLQHLAQKRLLNDEAIVVCEHPNALQTIEAQRPFQKIDRRHWGNVAVTLLRCDVPQRTLPPNRPQGTEERDCKA